ncbi:MAG: hypothetical protein HFJ87_07405 [Muribaculaceae bacterium]|nr:hypothetical protein [Muribaculaceae bacterium]MCI9054950.1 hypothetical protein [Muribaculaceae bacterium]
MNTPLIVWICIAAVAAILFIARIVTDVRHHRQSHRNFKLVSLGHEWEELYVPGDKIYHDDPKNDYDDI